jgi:hypothetical protein
MPDIDIVIKATAELDPVEKAIADMKELGDTITGRGLELEQPKVAAFAMIDAFGKAGDSASKFTDDLNTLGDAGTHAGGSDSSGLNWAASAIGTFAGNLASEAISKLPEIVSGLYKAGEAATHAATGFAALGGKDDDLGKLRTATESLVSDTGLMSAATTVMKNNFSASVGSVEDILDKGGKLGEIFEGSATEGVKSFSKAISEVGSYTSLDELGLDVDGVKEKFTKLKEMMSDRDAWGMAIMQEADEAIKKLPTSLDSTHPAIERFKTKIENFRDTAGKALTDWLDDSLAKLDKLFGGTNKISDQQANRQTVSDVGTRHGVDIDQQMADNAIDLYTTGKDSIAAYQRLVSTYGQLADEMLRSLGSRPAALDKIAEESGGFQPYYARYIPDYGAKTSGGGATTPSHGGGHSSQYGDVTGEGEGYGMYDQGGGGAATPARRDAATIEKPKVTAAEFDAITRSAGQASAATLAFGAAGALAMGGLALSSAVAASQIGNITTQGNGALSILKQLEVQLQTLASLTIVVNATTQGGGGTGSSRSGSGRGGGVQGPPR